MNVSEIIRELKMTKEEFFPLAVQLGFDIGERAIKVDDRIAVRLIQAIKQHRKSSTRQSLFAHEQVAATATSSEPSAARDRVITVPPTITTKQFADLLGKPVTEVIAILVRNGIMATINQNLDFETVSIIAEDLGYTTTPAETTVDSTKTEAAQLAKLKAALEVDTADQLTNRPPVVVVMGHVDHGKTKLLDAIRQTNIVDQEAGGITQSIGAYQIDTNDRSITFIDTPGHEAFTAMRSRGANVADLAVLVVAADDGIKPQTIEALQILEKAKLPFVVAINKIDKPEADIEKVKKELAELNLIPEDWGGQTICVAISAKAGTNIAGLLEMILLLTDIHQEKIKANHHRAAVGTIIESRIDKDAGPVATVLIQSGTLQLGDIVTVGEVSGKIKAMKSWKGASLVNAGPSTPVQFLGLKNAPVVGDVLTVTTDKAVLRKKKKAYQNFGYLKPTVAKQQSDKLRFGVILKADTLGSLEAIVEALTKLHYAAIELDIIKRGLGNFTEKDIDQAVAAKAKLIGFNAAMTPAAADYALGTQTTADTFSIIYKLIEHIQAELAAALPPEIIYTKIGEVKVLAVFRSNTKESIVGGRVVQGSIKNKAIAKILRNGKVVGEATVAQLQADKKNIDEVTNGSECGMRLEASTTIQEQDSLAVYLTEKKPRRLE
ncbi:MAG: translation initiation factor IF-2 [Candidatus Kerfeldbacteria bacterium]|nr:translation initiation factor IF-2 [Candidatus Kerfeldbacteria bacterium]